MANTPMTVKAPVSAAGQMWKPGEPVTSAAALKRISKDWLVPLVDEKPDQAQTDADGESWYQYQTIASVKASVDGDPERAAYALERERARPDERQRQGVFDYLLPLVGEDADDDDDADDGAEGGGE